MAATEGCQDGGGLSASSQPSRDQPPQVCEQSCAALCVLALRKPENSQVIVEGGGALAALEAMRAHQQEAGVQVGLGARRLVGRQRAAGCRPSLTLSPS